jgi:DNA replication and repair protein RecF
LSLTEHIQLQKISLYNFKNWEEFSQVMTDKMVCILGANGSGKTNLLDAIYYLCTTKSYFHSVDSMHISHGHEQASIIGDFLRAGAEEQIICALKRGHRKIVKRNFKEYERMSDHIGLLPVVMITPYDIGLIWEGSAERRKFMDGALSQMDNGYLNHWSRYQQALLQRNTILRMQGLSMDTIREQVEPWNFVLANTASAMYSARLSWVKSITARAEKMYEWISGGNELAEVTYASDLDELSDVSAIWDDVTEDYHAGRTRLGLHRDELHFRLNGRPVKKFGSQGQQKSFLIALKLAQLSLMQEKMDRTPILLLDDIFDKIDELRITRILQWLAETFHGQVFFTDTSHVRLPGLMQPLGIHPQLIFTS